MSSSSSSSSSASSSSVASPAPPATPGLSLPVVPSQARTKALDQFYTLCTRVEDGVFRPKLPSMRVNCAIMQSAVRKGVLPAGFKYIVARGIQLCLHPAQNTVSVCADDREGTILSFDAIDDTTLYTVLAWCMLALGVNTIDRENIFDPPGFMSAIMSIDEALNKKPEVESVSEEDWKDKYMSLHARYTKLKEFNRMLAMLVQSSTKIKKADDVIYDLSDKLRNPSKRFKM